LTSGEGRDVKIGDKDRLQNGSEISEVGENLDSLPFDGERRVTSSKVFKMTTLGSSPLTLHSLRTADVGLFAAELLHSLAGLDLDFSNASSAYSGSAEKLSGVITTWYVPGLKASAFLSLSSSEVSREKGGRESPREK
jgi:hypothetical protein